MPGRVREGEEVTIFGMFLARVTGEGVELYHSPEETREFRLTLSNMAVIEWLLNLN